MQCRADLEGGGVLLHQLVPVLCWQRQVHAGEPGSGAMHPHQLRVCWAHKQPGQRLVRLLKCISSDLRPGHACGPPAGRCLHARPMCHSTCCPQQVVIAAHVPACMRNALPWLQAARDRHACRWYGWTARSTLKQSRASVLRSNPLAPRWKSAQQTSAVCRFGAASVWPGCTYVQRSLYVCTCCDSAYVSGSV